MEGDNGSLELEQIQERIDMDDDLGDEDQIDEELHDGEEGSPGNAEEEDDVEADHIGEQEVAIEEQHEKNEYVNTAQSFGNVDGQNIPAQEEAEDYMADADTHVREMNRLIMANPDLARFCQEQRANDGTANPQVSNWR